METIENLQFDDEVSYLSELQRLERALSDSSSLPSRENGCPARNHGSDVVTPSEANRQRKIVYKVTLQPRLSESGQRPEIPPEYLELFEKLQPRIIARGLASDNESLLTLNRSLRPKGTTQTVASSNKSPVSERGAPLRVLGGRRMPPEALAAERQLAPWSVGKRGGSMTLPRRLNTGCTSPEIPTSRTLPTQVVGIKEPNRRMSFGGLNGRNTRDLGSTERPNSAYRTPTERFLRTRSYCDNEEDGYWAPAELFSSMDSSYRNYSQQVFRNARKLNSFSAAEEPEQHEFLRQLIGRRSGHFRPVSLDLSGAKHDQGPWPTPPTSAFNSPPPTSCSATVFSEDEETFRRNALLLHEMKRFGSMQGLEGIDNYVTASSAEQSNGDLSRAPGDSPKASTPNYSHRFNTPTSESSSYSPSASSATEVSRGCDFHPAAASACCQKAGAENGTKLEENPDTDAFNSSPGVELLFQKIARLSGHPETQRKLETLSDTTTEKVCTNVGERGGPAPNVLDLSNSMPFSGETEWSEMTDESSTHAEHERRAMDSISISGSSCPDDGEPGQSSSTQSVRGSTPSHVSSNDDDQLEEEDSMPEDSMPEDSMPEDSMPEESSTFVSKVTVLLRRPMEEQHQPDRPPVATGSTEGCRIQQLSIRQLKPIQEWTNFSDHR